MRALALEFVGLDLPGLVEGRGAAGLAGGHQVAGHLGLAIDGDAASAQQIVQVQALALAVDGELHAFMHLAFLVQPLGDAGLAQQIDRALFEHAGADAAKYVVGALTLDDDVVDTRAGEQLAQQQPGGARADDDDLGAHGVCPLVWRDRRLLWGSGIFGRFSPVSTATFAILSGTFQ